MSQLPKNWSIVPLGRAATLQRGFDLPVQIREPGNIPVFAANGPVGTHSQAKVSGPGVVTGRSGTLGQVHYVDTDFWPLNTALWVKDFHGNDPRWVSRLLTWMNLKQFTRGAGVPTLNRNLVHVVEIPLPPLAEQKRIAAILDAADALRAMRHESLAQLDTLLHSTFLDMFGDPVTNPKGWGTHTLVEITIKISDGEHLNPEFSDDGMPIVMAGNVLEAGVDMEAAKRVDRSLGEKFRRKCGPEKNDILIVSRGATIGRMCVVSSSEPFCLMGSVILVKPLNGEVDSAFLCWFLRHPATRIALYKTSGSSAQQAIYIKDVKRLVCIVPPIDLQRCFATFVESVEQQKTRLRKHLAELDTLFASLQHRAFNGEL